MIDPSDIKSLIKASTSENTTPTTNDANVSTTVAPTTKETSLEGGEESVDDMDVDSSDEQAQGSADSKNVDIPESNSAQSFDISDLPSDLFKGLTTEEIFTLTDLTKNNPTPQVYKALLALYKKGTHTASSKSGSGGKAGATSDAEAAMNLAWSRVVDAGVISSVTSIKYSIEDWKYDVLALAGNYPFKGQDSVNLVRRVVKGAMWNRFVAMGYTKNPGNHGLEYFLDKVVEEYLVSRNTNSVMRELLKLNLDYPEDADNFLSQWHGMFANKSAKEIGVSLALSLMSEANAARIETDQSVRTVAQVSAWVSKYSKARRNQARKKEQNGKTEGKNVNKKLRGFRCRLCKTNEHSFINCPVRKTKKTSTTQGNQ